MRERRKSMASWSTFVAEFSFNLPKLAEELNRGVTGTYHLQCQCRLCLSVECLQSNPKKHLEPETNSLCDKADR